MQKSKIEWCDMTWNPVTGCRNNCRYCYARDIVRRFEGKGDLREKVTGLLWDDSRIAACSAEGRGPIIKRDGRCYELKYPLSRGERPEPAEPYKGRVAHYPFGFSPTFHKYRLDEPAGIKKPQNIFVCSMADLFGEWVPDDWIKAVFDACTAAPQHRYIFLTKNPARYIKLAESGILPAGDNFWYGTTVTTSESPYFWSERVNTFLSIEPLQNDLGDFPDDGKFVEWVIIGAETGNRKGKIIPQREWIENIVDECRRLDVPVFMKNSLREIWDEPLIQEYPWGKGKGL
jgi:protein gp37